jgi:tRNA(Ser,Leu) C12 N-acetylase TAN1
MTPGERMKNWAEALMTLWPIILFLIGAGAYGNSETVKQWIHGPDDVVPVEMTDNEHNTKINAKFSEIEERIEKLEAESERDDGGLQSQINKLKQWHE